ncbi:MAG: ArsR family transcriptional regulator [Rhizobium sp.]|nr:ArsR family transcriptional regulator [Rhizobium sp.]
MEKSAALLNAMSNPKRLQILGVLSENEMSVGQLANLVDLSQSALSQHLAKLRAEKLVTTRRDAQTIYYSSRSRAVRLVLNALDTIFGTTASATAQE